MSVYSGKNLVLEKEHWVKWEHKWEMGADAARITGFDWNTYNERATDAVKIRDEFEKYLYDEDYLIVGQNIVGFDLYVDQIYRKLLGRPVRFDWVRRILDTQLLHKAIELNVTPPQIGTDAWVSFLFKMNSYRSRKLKSSLKHLVGVHGIDYEPDRHHNSATYDNSLCFQVLQKQLYKLEI